jgi:hypothetical protein
MLADIYIDHNPDAIRNILKHVYVEVFSYNRVQMHTDLRQNHFMKTANFRGNVDSDDNKQVNKSNLKKSIVFWDVL